MCASISNNDDNNQADYPHSRARITPELVNKSGRALYKSLHLVSTLNRAAKPSDSCVHAELSGAQSERQGERQ